MVYSARGDEAKMSPLNLDGGRGFECVCLQEVEIMFLERLRKENAAN